MEGLVEKKLVRIKKMAKSNTSEIATLTEAVKNLTKEMSDIKRDMKELIDEIRSTHTNTEILKMNVADQKEKHKDMDTRLGILEKKFDYFYTKISAIVTTLVFIGQLIFQFML